MTKVDPFENIVQNDINAKASLTAKNLVTPNDEKKVMVGMRLSKGLHTRLKVRAAQSGEPVNQYAERILAAALDSE